MQRSLWMQITAGSGIVLLLIATVPIMPEPIGWLLWGWTSIVWVLFVGRGGKE